MGTDICIQICTQIQLHKGIMLTSYLQETITMRCFNMIQEDKWKKLWQLCYAYYVTYSMILAIIFVVEGWLCLCMFKTQAQYDEGQSVLLQNTSCTPCAVWCVKKNNKKTWHCVQQPIMSRFNRLGSSLYIGWCT